MTIYSDKKHRRIYEQLNGPIPADDFGRTGGATNFKRYHFDNCKLKNLMTPPRE